MSMQAIAWEVLPYRMLLYQAIPCDIEQQHYRIGKERPPLCPKLSLLSLLFFSSLVTICPHLWMDQSMAHQLLSWMQRGHSPPLLDGLTKTRLWNSRVVLLKLSHGPKSLCILLKKNSSELISVESSQNCFSNKLLGSFQCPWLLSPPTLREAWV